MICVSLDMLLQMGMGRHANATAGGDLLRSELAAHQRALWPGSAGKLKNAWLPAYDRMAKKHAESVDRMLLHFDRDADRIRVCHCLTEDGEPRNIGMQGAKDKCVCVTYVHADGIVEELMSEPGELLIIWVPSGGFYAMSVSSTSPAQHTPPALPCRARRMPERCHSHLRACAGPRLRRRSRGWRAAVAARRLPLRIGIHRAHTGPLRTSRGAAAADGRCEG